MPVARHASKVVFIMAGPPESASPKSSPNFWVDTDPGLCFRNSKPLELLRYWEDKRGTRPMPARTDIDPLELITHMGSLILIEVQHAPLRLRYRLIGTNITTVMERDATGKYYDELYSDELLPQIYDRFHWILAHKAPLRTHGRAYYPNKNFYEYETLNLPLSDDGETVNMVLGELVLQIASTP